MLLIAADSADDPNFRRSVVVIVRHNDWGTLGLVLNRPSPVPLKKFFPDDPVLAAVDEPLYLGGPVFGGDLMYLFRADAGTAGGAMHVVDDVYASEDAELLDRLVAAPARPALRYFFGYAGWGAGQLARELADGRWLAGSATAEVVFDSSPRTLWRRLIHGREGPWVRLGRWPELRT